MKQHRVYRPDERPDIEVLVDGVWCDGELRMWTLREDGSWQGNVQWRWRARTQPSRERRHEVPPCLRVSCTVPAAWGQTGLVRFAC